MRREAPEGFGGPFCAKYKGHPIHNPARSAGKAFGSSFGAQYKRNPIQKRSAGYFWEVFHDGMEK